MASLRTGGRLPAACWFKPLCANYHTDIINPYLAFFFPFTFSTRRWYRILPARPSQFWRLGPGLFIPFRNCAWYCLKASYPNWSHFTAENEWVYEFGEGLKWRWSWRERRPTEPVAPCITFSLQRLVQTAGKSDLNPINSGNPVWGLTVHIPGFSIKTGSTQTGPHYWPIW